MEKMSAKVEASPTAKGNGDPFTSLCLFAVEPLRKETAINLDI
jgi:hypothetical protein